MKKSRLLGIAIVAFGAVSGCSREQPINKAMIGTWVQETPTSTTTGRLQTTTSDTVLQLKKNGETHLTRNLDLIGEDLPETGISVSVELRGSWELTADQLRQTPNSILIMPRTLDKETRDMADELQSQAEKNPPSVKTILSADRKQLILQDVETGITDVYIRK